MNVFYVIAAAIAFGCIGAVLVFDVAFGCRALFHVKRKFVNELPKGFSPLDYQRVMKGKTRPQALTRALLVWWAQRGYIEIEGRAKNTVRVRQLKEMPPHKEAEFYDRGTYVREREIFNYIFARDNMKNYSGRDIKSGYRDININAPLITRKSAESVNKSFSIGENEGVFGAGHFILKIVTQILCFVPYFMAVAWATYDTGEALFIALSIFSVIGVLALKYVIVIPPAIRYPFFSLWGGLPYIAIVTTYFQQVAYDPWYFGLAALIFYALGTFIFILFADYREKENLKEYSDLFNFRNYLFFCNKKAVDPERYYELLPFLYTINCAQLLKPKFRSGQLPEWYRGERGALL